MGVTSRADELLGELKAYMAVNAANLQQVQGHWYYIVDLRVTDWRGFRTAGGVVPSYIVVDAMDPIAPVVRKDGYKMMYVPDARWNQDLERHVYLNFQLGSQWRVDDLKSLEVDENWKPFYTGTLLRHSIGWQGMTVDGMIVVDPETGEITKYDLEDVPAWINRIWSIPLVSGYAQWWADYSGWNACQFQGNAGRRRIDMVNDVITSQGLEFQVTITAYTIGEGTSNNSLTEVLYVNPRTGRAVKYPLTGAPVQAVDDLVDSETTSLLTSGYEPVECELQIILGRQVWYCILNSRGAGSGESKASYSGVAFVQVQYTKMANKVIVDTTLQGAYARLRQQIAEESSDDPTIKEDHSAIQVEGVVTHRAEWEDEGGKYVLFEVTTAESQIVYFQANAQMKEAAWLRVGDVVVVTGYTSDSDYIVTREFVPVTAITIVGGPNFEK